MYNRHTLPKQ